MTTKPQVTPQKFVFDQGESLQLKNGNNELVELPMFKVTIETDAYMTDKKILKEKLQSIFEEVLEYFD